MIVSPGFIAEEHLSQSCAVAYFRTFSRAMLSY